MAAQSNIEWTDATWPIVQGCDPVSRGCVHCYAVPLLWRMMHNPDPKISGPLQGLTEKHRNAAGEDVLRFTGKVALREDRLTWPLSWKTPRMIFVPSHGDLFHKDVPDSFIDKVFGTMGACDDHGLGHQLQVLTKRSERQRDYVATRGYAAWNARRLGPEAWPARNIWFGVSAEDQANADERIPHLLATPAAVRFVSLEPLLGPIDLTAIPRARAEGFMRPLDGRFNTLDWVIAGGESGKGARPMHPDWVRSLRDQCDAADVRFFFKQWGAWLPSNDLAVEAVWNREQATVLPDGRVREWQTNFPASRLTDPDMRGMTRVGKTAAGRLLDGREHSEFPKVTS